MARHRTLAVVEVLMVVLLISLTTGSHVEGQYGFYGPYGGSFLGGIYGGSFFGGLYGRGSGLNLYGVNLGFLDDPEPNSLTTGIVHVMPKNQVVPLLGSVPLEPVTCKNPRDGASLTRLNHIPVLDVKPEDAVEPPNII